MSKHKVFISYHHANDQIYKDNLVKFNEENDIFIDMSVDSSGIDDTGLNSEQIRAIIRDKYLRDSTVTIILIGTETKNRKHVDWEIFSSMYNGTINKKSGILLINLPSISQSVRANGENEKKLVFNEIPSWTSINTREDYIKRYPYMPERIIDNFLKDNVKISVANWKHLTVSNLRLLIKNAFDNRTTNDYDLSTPMRTNNS